MCLNEPDIDWRLYMVPTSVCSQLAARLHSFIWCPLKYFLLNEKVNQSWWNLLTNWELHLNGYTQSYVLIHQFITPQGASFRWIQTRELAPPMIPRSVLFYCMFSSVSQKISKQENQACNLSLIYSVNYIRNFQWRQLNHQKLDFPEINCLVDHSREFSSFMYLQSAISALKKLLLLS